MHCNCLLLINNDIIICLLTDFSYFLFCSFFIIKTTVLVLITKNKEMIYNKILTLYMYLNTRSITSTCMKKSYNHIYF